MDKTLTPEARILVTGPTSFLGYHVVQRLNQRGLRPRVLVPDATEPAALRKLDVEIVRGSVEEPGSLRAACDGVTTVFHLAFLVALGGRLEARLEAVNVAGTRHLVEAAAEAGVSRMVLVSSALAVGINQKPQPLDETADWTAHRLNLPYALSRRQAEQEALARASASLAVVAVNPSFTLGPEDPVGAPANRLLKTVAAGKLPFTFPIGFGCLDVRDFAEGMLLAAERGRSGQRYLLSGHNLTLDEFVKQAADLAGVRPPRWRLPVWLARGLGTVLGAGAALVGKRLPVNRSVLDILGRYAWYDASLARRELGWEPRPLRQTLEDTLSWLSRNEAAA